MSSAGPEPLDDLLRRAGAGDAAALEDLVRRYEPRLRLAAKSLLKPGLRHLVDSVDLVQSVHRSLLPGLRAGRYAFDDENRLIALAVTVLRNKVHRAARRAKAVPPDAAQPGREPAPGDEFAAHELFGRLLDELEPLDRRLVELRCQDFSTAEIAAVLHCTPAVLRARLSRLRRRLREAGHAEWL